MRRKVLPVMTLAALSFFSTAAFATSFHVLHRFTGGTDGARPTAGLLLDQKGNLYGTTTEGGGGACKQGCGTVFRLASDGTEIILHAFAGGSDGATPYAALASDAQGNLYGTTVEGGAGCQKTGCGIVFKITPAGHEAVVYAFKGRGDGSHPYSTLLSDAAGNLYGTTFDGGNKTGPCYRGCGTIFRLSAAGKLKTLYEFTNGDDGAFPYGGLVSDNAGNLYGTASAGGAVNQCGTVFKLSSTAEFSVLHAFGESDGCAPAAKLFLDAEGNLFGTTDVGGFESNAYCGSYSPYGCGVVFRIAKKGDFKVLHKFKGANGDDPHSGVLLDPQGSIYGAAELSAGAWGTLYRLGNGTASTLYTFKGKGDGGAPEGELLLDEAGDLYGTALVGGDSDCNCGTIYSLTP